MTGNFLATATLKSDGLLFGDVAQWGNLLRGYEAWIQKEKQKIYALWYGNLDDEDFY